MTIKQNALLEEYAAKKAELQALEEELVAMEPKVLTALEKAGVDTLKENYGTFSVVYRKRWTYSEELTEKEKEYKTIVKARQQEEQQSGEATAEETKGLSFRAYKPE
jgi:alpha-galactosidase/6-phospho-beta-glucosidase family protein